jgi:hypothetical protein
LEFKPEEIRHMGTRFNEHGVDVDICYGMKDEAGRSVYVVMDGSPSDDHREEVIKIYGSEGVIKIKFEGKSSSAYIEKDGKEEKIGTEKALSEITELGIKDFKSHPALIHNFVAFLKGDVKINANPGKEGIMPVYLTELVEKSRGETKEDSLSKEELQELSAQVNDNGKLDIKRMEELYSRGKEMRVDNDILKKESSENNSLKEINKKFLR